LFGGYGGGVGLSCSDCAGRMRALGAVRTAARRRGRGGNTIVGPRQ